MDRTDREKMIAEILEKLPELDDQLLAILHRMILGL